MKRVHTVLQLRHHKHTAKLLPHKHTSYGALFLLMLVPVIMLALVGRLVFASDYEVTATVPAPIPSGAPVITSPTDGSTVHTNTITVSGTCPVITPAVVIAIYDGSSLIGSAICSAAGDFSVPISLPYGEHSLVATVVTITGGIGQSSAPVKVTRADSKPIPDTHSPQTVGGAGVDTAGGSLLTPLYIVPDKPLLTLDANKHVVWRGTITGGQLPYKITVDWGDGTSDTYEVKSHDLQTFTHDYDRASTYSIRLYAEDARQQRTVLYSVAVTFSVAHQLLLDTTKDSTPGFVAFVQRHVVHIYIVTLSALVFLWFIEHGRHFVRQPMRPARHTIRSKRR